VPVLATTLLPAPEAPSRDVAGAYAGSLRSMEPGLAGRFSRERLRRKRWMYVVVASDEAFAAAAVVHGGWFAGAFAWAVDRASGAVVLEASAAGLPGLSASVTARTGPGASARFTGLGLSVRVDRGVRSWLLEVRTPRGSIEAALEVPRAAQPFTLVAGVPGGGVRATEKSGALPATGEVRAGNRSLALAGGFGGVDVTCGVLARETRWRWAFATGHAGGEPFAFNLCEGFGVPTTSPGENAVFDRGIPYGLQPVAFEPGAGDWRIASDDGSVELRFTPAAAHRERRNLGVLRTRFTQLAGVFNGTIAGRNGAVAVVDLPGVVEDHWAVW
jgi:hypothetical protein